MINAVRLESVRAHADTRIEFDRFTALVGPNSTGKSTVLGVIDRVCHMLRHPFACGEGDRGDWFEGPFDPSLVARRGSSKFSIDLAVTGRLSDRFRFNVTQAPDTWTWLFATADESLRAISSKPTAEQLAIAKHSPRANLLGLTFACSLFRLDAQRISERVYLHQANSFVRSNGDQTAFALLDLLQRRDKRPYDAVVRDLRRLVPSLEGVRAVVEASNTATVRLLYDFADAIDVEATAVSEGTLLATAMLVALHSANGPRILLLDDIERGLHPTAQLRFVKQLKQLLDREPELQIIATTHSPYILDELEPSQVRAFARRRDGSIAVKSLAEHPEAKATAGSLTTGQLWALDDEAQWVLPPEERAA